MISRRAFSAALVAIPVGVTGGLLTRRWTTATASISFLGQDQTMFALLDTGESRALFLLGEPNSELARTLPELLTVGNSRVDLLAASHRWLTTPGMRQIVDFDSTSVISLQADLSVPPIRGNITPVTDQQLLGLAEKLTIEIMVVPGANRDPDDPHFSSHIQFGETVVALATGEGVLDSLGQPVTLLAIPGELSPEVTRQFESTLIVSSNPISDSTVSGVQTFANEPIRFEIHGDGITIVER